jgi:hypothetical protein
MIAINQTIPVVSSSNVQCLLRISSFCVTVSIPLNADSFYYQVDESTTTSTFAHSCLYWKGCSLQTPLATPILWHRYFLERVLCVFLTWHQEMGCDHGRLHYQASFPPRSSWPCFCLLLSRPFGSSHSKDHHMLLCFYTRARVARLSLEALFDFDLLKT